MPKDPTKNIGPYKIQGGEMNEYEFRQNEGAIEEQERAAGLPPAEGLQGAAEPGLPQNVAQRIQEVEAAVRAKVRKDEPTAKKAAGKGGAKKAAPAKKAAKVAVKNTGAKKPAAKKAAPTKKAAPAKKVVSAKKAAGRKDAARKGAASSTRKAVKKR